MRKQRNYKGNSFERGGIIGKLIGDNTSGESSGAEGTTAKTKSKFNAGAAAGGVGQIIGDISNNLSVETPEDPEPTATTREELYQQAISFRDFQPEMSNTALSGLSSGLSGASAGMSAGGPWGALIGGVVGTTGGVLSSIFGNKRRERAAKRYNEKASRIFTAAEDKMDDSIIANSMFNYSAEGGPLFAYGGNFSDGLTEFNSGGIHEANPYGGVMQGVGNNGQPNLVEEGETKYNNFIFSNRLKVNKDFIKPFDLPGKIKNKTYADASKILTKEAKERPNDPISQNGVRAKLDRLKDSQESYKGYQDFEKDYNDVAIEMGLDDMTFAKGGKIHIKPSKRGTFTAAAKKHGKSVQAFARQVLANKGKYSPAMVKKANFAHVFGGRNYSDGGSLFEDIVQDYAYGGMIRNVQNRFNILPDGTVSKFDWGGDLPNTHENTYKGRFPSQGMGVYPEGGPLGNGNTMYEKLTVGSPYPGENTRYVNPYGVIKDLVEVDNTIESGDINTDNNVLATGNPGRNSITQHSSFIPPQYQSILNGDISLLGFEETPMNLAPVDYADVTREDVLGEPDGKRNKLRNALRGLGEAAPMISNFGQLMGAITARPETVRFQRINVGTPLDDYLPYQPIDREYYANKIREYGRTTDANIMNLSGGNRATATANLLASSRNTQDAIGDMYFKADQENRNRYLQSKQFRNNARLQNARLNALQQQFNSELGMKEDTINAMNRAARRREISRGLDALAGNMAGFARNRWNKNQVRAMSNYDTNEEEVKYRR